MKNLEFFRNIGIGQYIDTNSWFHRLGAVRKYIFALSLGVVAVAAPTPVGAAISAALAVVLTWASGIKPGFLFRSMKPIVPVIAFAGILQFLFRWPSDDSANLLNLGLFTFTVRELWIVSLILARTSAMMISVGWFTSIITEADAARGVEDILRPLSTKTFPAHRLALAAATAIRFVPIVAGELEEIVKAQASRGADFGSGKKGIFAKARAYLPLFVPVTVRALERAELLAEAMEARCYTGEGMTLPPKRKPIRGEIAGTIGIVIFAIVVLAMDTMYIEAWIRPF